MSLTSKQQQAIPILGRGGTHNEAAAASGVSDRTILRWLELDEFQLELKKFRDQVYDKALGKLTDAAVGAVEVLDTIANDPDALDGSRVAAAKAILALLLRDRSSDLNSAISLLRRYGFQVLDSYQERDDGNSIEDMGSRQGVEVPCSSQPRPREGDRPDSSSGSTGQT